MKTTLWFKNRVLVILVQLNHQELGVCMTKFMAAAAKCAAYENLMAGQLWCRAAQTHLVTR